MMNWIKINPMPKHEEEVDILLKNGKVLLNGFYDSIEQEFYFIIDKNYFFYPLHIVESWKKRSNKTE